MPEVSRAVELKSYCLDSGVSYVFPAIQPRRARHCRLALMIFLPGWSVTKWIARSRIFPIYLTVLYTVGVLPLIASKPGIVAEFGSFHVGLTDKPTRWAGNWSDRTHEND